MTQTTATQQASDKNAIRPFQVNVPEAELDDLRRRIQAMRWPEKERRCRSSPDIGRRNTIGARSRQSSIAIRNSSRISTGWKSTSFTSVRKKKCLAGYHHTITVRGNPMVASSQALGEVYQSLVSQATLLAYIDNFRLLTFLCALCIPAALLFKRVIGSSHVSALH